MVLIREKLWLTADFSRLVPDLHPDAAFLYSIAGKYMPEADAEKFGLVDGRLPTLSEPAHEPVIKEAFPLETKEILPEENKRKKKKKGDACA